MLSPELLITKNKGLVTSSFEIEYVDHTTGQTLRQSCGKIFLAKFTGINGSIPFNNVPPDNEEWSDYVRMQSHIRSCVIAAEHVKTYLLKVNLILTTISPDEVKSLRESSLMQLKERLVEYSKRDGLPLIKQHEYFKDPKQFKDFRRDFNQFILDRNIYTHGQLHFLEGNDAFVIEYIDPEETFNKYGVVTTEVLQSYLEFYKLAIEFIDIFYQEKTVFS